MGMGERVLVETGGISLIKKPALARKILQYRKNLLLGPKEHMKPATSFYAAGRSRRCCCSWKAAISVSRVATSSLSPLA